MHLVVIRFAGDGHPAPLPSTQVGGTKLDADLPTTVDLVDRT